MMAYFSNSSEGMVFDAQCMGCPYGEGPCPIAFVQMEFNYEQCSDGQEKLKACLAYLVDDNLGCMMKTLIDAKADN